ncbi:MAG: GNAT family N-acetyltransferase [Nitrosopumilaceae archaeon]
MTGKMQIRDAIPTDKTSVLDFCKETFSWGDYISDVWDYWILEGKLLVIEEDNNPIGLCHAYFFPKRQAWIEGIRIHPKYRNQGYGRRLILHAESIAQTNSCKIARMIIENENKISLKLAHSIGYYIEDRWRLYYLVPKKQIASVSFASDGKQVVNLISSNTYANSWKWLPAEKSDIKELINKKRVLVSLQNGSVLAVGIWNVSEHFASTLQLGLINGTQNGINDILHFMQNMGHELGYQRIQVFCQEKIHLQMADLDKRALFCLMRKDLR